MNHDLLLAIANSLIQKLGDDYPADQHPMIQRAYEYLESSFTLVTEQNAIAIKKIQNEYLTSLRKN